MNERLGEQARRIEEHVAAAYRLSGQDFLKLILNQESPETVERMAVYHRYFSDARLQALEAYRGTSAELERVAKRVQSQHDAEVEEQADLRNRQRELESERRQRQSLLAELDEAMEDRTTLRKRLVADQVRLQRLVAELRRRASELDGTQFAARKGALPWPAVKLCHEGLNCQLARGNIVAVTPFFVFNHGLESHFFYIVLGLINSWL